MNDRHTAWWCPNVPCRAHFGNLSFPPTLKHVRFNPKGNKCTTVRKNCATVAVAPGRLHEPAVLVIARHRLVAVSLTTLLGISLDLRSQQHFRFPLWQNAVGPVSHRLCVILVAGAILRLNQGVQMRIFTFFLLLTFSCGEN